MRIGASTLICGAIFLAPLGAAGLLLEDRVLEHRLVKLEADLLDVARLLVAEQIAGAANVEVVAGELEAGAEAVEIGQHLQPFLGAFGHLSGRARSSDRRRRGSSTGPTRPRSWYSWARPKRSARWTIKRVGGRDVEPAFDDRGRQQHVIFAVVEGAHPLLDLGRRSSGRGR